MSQKYSGDITLIPDVNYLDFFKILSNPTRQFILDALDRGQRTAWPSMKKKRPPKTIDSNPPL
jgi:TAG lipase/steryl ester hydrolase/phospholipase A2/LPA acyltransferase